MATVDDIESLNVNVELRARTLDSSRGARMGRATRCADPYAEVVLQAVALHGDAYDPGGVYWGMSQPGERLWCAMDLNDDVFWTGRHNGYTRAWKALLEWQPDLRVVFSPAISVEDVVEAYLDTAIQDAELSFVDDSDNWKSDDEPPVTDRFRMDNVAESYRESLRLVCHKFVEENRKWLLMCLEALPLEEQIGHDLYLTRNHHGTGFWDREWADEHAGERLTAAAYQLGPQSIVIGDDGKLYGE